MLLILDPERGRIVSGDVLRKYFELTPAEARLTAGLVNGETVAEYACRVGIATGTARAVLKQVFRKTGATSQPGLIRLVLKETIGEGFIDDNGEVLPDP